MATVVSVNISEQKGTQKHPVPEIQLKLRHGIVGDAHAGDWHRQISLLAEESVDTMRAACPMPLDAGVFAENINTGALISRTCRWGLTAAHRGNRGGGDPDRQGVPQRLRHQKGRGQVRHAHGRASLPWW
ncbi:MAG: hypothetical protein V8R40_09360 [Dysosmobacter sp.]